MTMFEGLRFKFTKEELFNHFNRMIAIAKDRIEFLSNEVDIENSPELFDQSKKYSKDNMLKYDKAIDISNQNEMISRFRIMRDHLPYCDQDISIEEMISIGLIGDNPKPNPLFLGSSRSA